MANVDLQGARRFPTVSRHVSFLNLAGTCARIILAAVATTLFVVTCFAQDSPQTATQDSQNQNSQDQNPQNSGAQNQESQQNAPFTETIPAGTRLDLVLTTPVFSNTIRSGDEIHLQTTAPITSGDHVVIPGGAFVQGKLDKLSRHGSRSEMKMQSVSVIFPDGYVAKIPGPINVEGEEGTAWLNPSSGTKAGMFLAPALGLGLGAAIGSAAHTTQTTTFAGQTMTTSTPKGIAIGSGVGLGIGGAVALALLFHSHQFFVDSGSPMRMTLNQPLTLASDQVADANRAAQTNPPPVPMPTPRVQPAVLNAPVNHGTCFTPGTPGTPSTVIAGAPGPNGAPGPPTVIPGTPAIPGTAYPCP